jgi:hypothetical protein
MGRCGETDENNAWDTAVAEPGVIQCDKAPAQDDSTAAANLAVDQ